ENGTTHAVFEMSSHAMHQERTAGLELDAAVLTNITHDHLDYHIDFEHYKQSKAHILNHAKPGGFVLLNQNDPHLRSLDCPQHLRVSTYAGPDSNVRASHI